MAIKNYYTIDENEIGYYVNDDVLHPETRRFIPAYPTSLSPSHNLVSKSWNDMNGVFHDIPVNSKLKINWVFDVICEEAVEYIFGTLIMNKILGSSNNNPSRFFLINTYYPGLGWIERNMYLGTPTNFSSLGAHAGHGMIKYWKMELHWIDVEGTVLNSPQNWSENSRNIIVDNRQIEIASPEDLANILGEQR